MSFYNAKNNVCNAQGNIVAVIVPILCDCKFAREMAEIAAEKLNDKEAIGDPAAFELHD